MNVFVCGGEGAAWHNHNIWSSLAKGFQAITGNHTTGNLTTGNRTTGNRTTGNLTTGNLSTGNLTTGNHITGNHTTGNLATGNLSTGNQITKNRQTLIRSTRIRTTGNHTLESHDKESHLVHWSYGKVNAALSKIFVHLLSPSGRGINGHLGEPVLCKRMRLQSTLVEFHLCLASFLTCYQYFVTSGY